MPSVFPPLTPGASSTRLVVSISSDSSGSGWTSSISRSPTGAGGGGGGGGGEGGPTGAGAGAAPTGALAPFGWRGSSRSRKTRLDVLRLPDFVTSSPAPAGGAVLGAGGVLARPPPTPAEEPRLPGSAPYILRCSVSISRRFALSDEMSVNSFSAAKAWSIFPTFCIRSAYSTKFCLASAMKPLAAYSLASLR